MSNVSAYQQRMRRGIQDALVMARAPVSTGVLMEACGWPEGRLERKHFNQALDYMSEEEGLRCVREEHGVRYWARRVR